MVTHYKFNQPTVSLSLAVVVDEERYVIECRFSTDHSPADLPPKWQLIARRRDGAGQSFPIVPLSREYETKAKIQTELQNGLKFLSDNSHVDGTRQRIIDAMLRMKAIEAVQPPLPPPRDHPD
jgi:hypothetical protein